METTTERVYIGEEGRLYPGCDVRGLSLDSSDLSLGLGCMAFMV